MELGRYRLVAELARGGMGVIHLAEARGPGGFEKLVVVKELKQELADDPVYTTMFLAEARLAARLNHRHIVQTHEVGCDDGRYFMALELLEGGSLHQVRQKLGLRALPVALGLRVLCGVLEALEHAHGLTDEDGSSLAIVHRDVSPQNIFLTFDGDVKLIDFGVAKSADRRGQATTQVGVVKGSVPYMSPDHLDGTTIDRRADVFAVGVIMREMLVGERLWGDVDDLTMLRRLIAGDLPPLPTDTDVAPELLAVVERAMAPRRADRFESARAMRESIARFLIANDPRGSLADLGPWLERVLHAERAAFREVVRRGRASNRNAVVRANEATTRVEARGAHVWLPSSDLATRVTTVPPVPPHAQERRPTAFREVVPASRGTDRVRNAFAGLMFGSAIVLAGLGFAHPLNHPSNTELGACVTNAVSAPEPREPRVAEDIAPPTLLTNTAIVEAPEGSEAPLADVAAAADAVTADSTAAATRAPSSVLHESLPANPYDSAD